jgi:hypothetical protein
MRHAGFALAILCFAGAQALAAGPVHQPGATHPGGAHVVHQPGATHPGSAHAAGNGRFLIGVRTAGLAHVAAVEHECYSAAQTREKIASRKLAEPFRLLVGAASRYQAEPLGVRLCRHKEQLIYEISVLRANGRVVHVFANAVNGQVLNAKNAK